jgi:aflatoxin B1 aldehyde reductase
MRTPIPRLYMGTMTFAWTGQTSSVVDEVVGLEMIKKFVEHNEASGQTTHLIDTARVYAAGKTEPMVGTVLKNLGLLLNSQSTVLVGTKANPAMEGGLSTEGIKDQIKASLDAMQLSSFGEYYLHQPDTEHPLLESLQCAHSLISEGTVKALGMSNYHASEMERAFQLCKEHKLTPPTVYQGLYNPLNRMVEEELLPILRKHDCSFVAYNPLAAGLLAGKHQKVSEVAEGRFKNNPNYLPRFYTDANFKALELIREACDKEGISMVEASYCWLLRHSQLKADTDGILLGASSMAQLNQNLDACTAAAEKGPLSDEMLAAFDKAWELTKAGAFPYWRSYSSDFPNQENLDPGASYTVKK